MISKYNLTSYGLAELVKEGLPHYKSGKVRYFPKSEVDAWMASQQKEIDMLKTGMKINNNTLAKTFKCSTQGGMRRSHKTNTLVLIAKPTNEVYIDRWENDILHYTGMGQIGDQKLKGNQNITLFESNTNNIDIHLFEVLKPNEYTYMGKVRLAYQPYQVVEKDSQNNSRYVWKFPLRLIGD
ncbi:hypothetical protein BI350_01770 [Sporosarcina ureilytica]|uniref:ScoMcrA-like SRA domain-containing protein n=2 Tax=Sporosarcina ureilytica TaxID=298596 RepID=A0A1D8JK00_9BACL|nr:hypothetical protein BI350_01770 [Sporosarcina ureilytica]